MNRSSRGLRPLIVLLAAGSMAFFGACETKSAHEQAVEPAASSSTPETSESPGPSDTPAESAAKAKAASGPVQLPEDTCDPKATIEDTVLQDILDDDQLPMQTSGGNSTEPLTDLTVVEDFFDGCEPLSIAILGGTYLSDSIEMPIVFQWGQMVDHVSGTALPPGVEVKKSGDDITLTAEGKTTSDSTGSGTIEMSFDSVGAINRRSELDNFPDEADFSDYPQVQEGFYLDRYYQIPLTVGDDEEDLYCHVTSWAIYCTLDGAQVEHPEENRSIEAFAHDFETGRLDVGQQAEDLEDEDWEELEEGRHLIGPLFYPWEIEIVDGDAVFYVPNMTEHFGFEDGVFKTDI